MVSFRSQWDVSQLSALARPLISTSLWTAESRHSRLAIFPLMMISIFETIYTALISHLYVYSRQDDAPPSKVHILIPRTYKCVASHDKGTLKM